MTTPQAIYLILIGLYLLLFLSFLRLFAWKRYADRTYWKKRPILSLPILQGLAATAGRDVPRFSVFVPARDEADVIEKTIEHLSQLDYPRNSYEILIATDEKELIAAAADRDQLAEALKAFLTGERPWPSDNENAEALLVGLLARLALEESDLAERQAGHYLSVKDALTLPAARQRQIIHQAALELLQGKGRLDRTAICASIQRALEATGKRNAEEAERLYPVFLSFAMPVVLAYTHLRKAADEKLVARMVSAAQARQAVTQRVLATLADSISHRILRRLTTWRKSGHLWSVMPSVYAEVFPTTQDIVERKRVEFQTRPETPVLKHVCVPYDFDGNLGGVCTGQSVPSTKGRALNYAFRFANPGSDMFGYYDAESRPDGKVLQYVAYKRLTEGNSCNLLQGPVFQVRNFFQMGPFCKVVSLYQAISHDWNLPNLMRTLPFVGGTNLFMDPVLLERIGGYDHHCLTEDLELGVRAYMQEDAWPEYLPYPSSEQTPTTLRAFFRQRLRWGSGYLQVYEKVQNEASFPEAKRKPMLRELWMRGQFQWILYQTVCFAPPIIWILYSLGLIDPTIVPYWWRFGLNSFSVMYLGFTFYVLYRYRRHLDTITHPNPWLVKLGGVAQLFLLPLSAFVLPVPYSSALVLKSLGRAPKAWVKTPRTKE